MLIDKLLTDSNISQAGYDSVGAWQNGGHITHPVNCYRHAELLLPSTRLDRFQAPKRS
ncbi:hypothetical protein YSA_07344 [Pseudomonas putida ND6]|uniref:Uncharacterized protein n=1 Tax=Pseudomonas putida ND6 TaxID=231023 RepID=I3UZ22_PSEPU|nr:hypothetical protein YSA_07344 [Pseudomonas putida ND6]